MELHLKYFRKQIDPSQNIHEGLAQELLQDLLVKIEHQKSQFNDAQTFTMKLKFQEAADHFRVSVCIENKMLQVLIV